MTATELHPDRVRTDVPPIFHLFCPCDPDVGLCGQDLTDVPFSDGENEQECVVCFDMEAADAACPRCGS